MVTTMAGGSATQNVWLIPEVSPIVMRPSATDTSQNRVGLFEILGQVRSAQKVHRRVDDGESAGRQNDRRRMAVRVTTHH